MRQSQNWLAIGVVATAFGWGAGAPAATMVTRAPAVLVQGQNREAQKPLEHLETAHFRVEWDPRVLGRERAEAAGRIAEAGWARCERVFGSSAAPGARVRLDLTPDFEGATGFARPANPKKPEEPPLIGVRLADLEYLGLSAEYVLTHEIAHLFSGPLAGSALGEGIADWGAGGFNSIPLRPWWGHALKDAGLWIDPDAFFITGEFPANPQVDAEIRTAQYVQSALLVQFLADRFGWERTRAFAEKYSEARGRLISNEDRARLRSPRRGPRAADARRLPDPEKVQATFQEAFGRSWDQLRTDWEQSMKENVAPGGQAERLVLGQKLYGAVRNYEMWLIRQRPRPATSLQEAIREAFVAANRSLAAGELESAESGLLRARQMIERLKRPQSIARRTGPLTETRATG